MVTRIKELSAILEVSYALNSVASFPRLLDFTLEMALNVTGGERALMMLFNEDLGRLETVAMVNFDNNEVADDLQATSFLVSRSFDTGESIIGPSYNFRNPNPKLKGPEDAGILSVAIVPLKELSNNIGVLYVDTKRSGNIMTSRTDQLLKIFAAQASVAINRTKMYYSSTTDNITGIANENLFTQRLNEEFCRAQRYRKDISLILMDLDHFSAINETYGENIGNKILKEVGKMFRSATRIHDLVARFGADSFAMLLPETPYSGAVVAANKLKASLSQTKVRAGDQTIMLTGSFGLSSSSAATTKPNDLMTLAEKALKLARKRGGNQIA
jgi:diguanylate cyclase (GGDEF)-like protein